MVGFTFEANQEDIRKAQDNLENVIEDQLLGRIDDLIDALNERKNDTNIYDAKGVLLGTQYTTPQLDNLASILSDYYSGLGSASPLSAIKDSLLDQLVSTINNNSSDKSTSISIGEINVNEVDNARGLAEAIVETFPNAILQALYKN